MATGAKKESRGQWSSRTGFILAAVGSAVGLGNIWRFPFTTAENGGAVFVLIYIVILLLLGIPAMWAELVLGRRGGLSPVGTMQKLSQGKDKRPSAFWTAIGFYFVAFSMFILAWYAVISGWVMNYFVNSFSGAFLDDPQTFFNEVVEGPTTLFYHALTILLTVAIVAGGVSKGIERVSLVMMPILFALIIFIAVYAFFLSGAGAGYDFFLQPDFGELSGDTVRAATGQAFFSLSLGMGAILTYASYLSKKESLSSDGTIIAFADSGVALMGGLMVFPILAAFGLLTFAVSEGGGPGAVFLAIPAAFDQLGGFGGQALTIVFFTALFFAAFSSAISLLEVSVSFMRDRWGIARPKAAILMGLVIYVGGILGALNENVFNVESGILTDVLVIFGGLMIVLFVGYRVKGAAEELDRNARWRVSRIGMPLIRFLAPAALGTLFLLSLQDFFVDVLGSSNDTAVFFLLAVVALIYVAALAFGWAWLRRDANKRAENGTAWATLYGVPLLVGAAGIVAGLLLGDAGVGMLDTFALVVGIVFAAGALATFVAWHSLRPDEEICNEHGRPLPGKKREYDSYRRILNVGSRPAA